MTAGSSVDWHTNNHHQSLERNGVKIIADLVRLSLKDEDLMGFSQT